MTDTPTLWPPRYVAVESGVIPGHYVVHDSVTNGIAWHTPKYGRKPRRAMFANRDAADRCAARLNAEHPAPVEAS